MNTRFDVPFLTDLSELLHLLRHKSQSNMETNIFPSKQIRCLDRLLMDSKIHNMNRGKENSLRLILWY
jgi:hypothetical protein